MKQIIKVKNELAKDDHNPAAIYLVGLSGAGRYTMRRTLETIAAMVSNGETNIESFAWNELRFQHVTAIKSKLESAGYKPATINKFLAALRGTSRAAWLDGQMSAEDYQRVKAVKIVKNDTLPAGRGMTKSELSALLSACEDDETPAGARDAAIIAMMYSCGGLRRAEVVSLDLADYDAESGRLKIRGKGNKERTAYVTGGAEGALSDWLNLRGDNLGALFVAINKGGNIQGGRLTSQAIYNMLQKRGDEAGVKSFSPHDLRRSFISDLLDAGADITTVSKMAGHANVTTTSRYDRRPEEAKRKAASLLHVPYHGRA
jgi:site-specific recombinase XerD